MIDHRTQEHHLPISTPFSVGKTQNLEFELDLFIQ